MLRLVAAQAETLWDEALPIEVRELPEDLAALDELCATRRCWRRSWSTGSARRCCRGLGGRAWAPDAGDRDVCAVDGAQTPLRLGVPVTGRRGFRLDPPAPILSDRADRSGARRVDGAQADEADRRADRQRHHARADRGGGSRAALSGARGQDRLDGDRGRHQVPDDAGLASHGVRSLARKGRKLAAKLGEPKTRVRDRSRAMGRKLRAISRTIRRRSGEAKAEVLALTEQTGQLLAQSVKEARRLAATARRKARGRGAQAKLQGGSKARRASRSLREGRHADQAARRRREDHRPPDLALRSRRQADPQGQARQAQRVRLRRADRRDHRRTPSAAHAD